MKIEPTLPGDETGPMHVVGTPVTHDLSRFRFTKGKLAPLLLIVFGLGLGVIVSELAIKSTPVNNLAGPGGFGPGTQAGGNPSELVAQPITQKPLTSGTSKDSAASYKTASIKPDANQLVLAAVTNEVAGKDAHPKLSSGGLKWTEVASAANSKARVTVLRAMGNASSGPLTITYPEKQHNAAWAVSEFNGVDTTGDGGSNAVLNAVTKQAGKTDSLAVTLAKFATKTDATYGAFVGSGSGAISPGSGFSKIHDEGVGSVRELTEWRADNATKVDASAASATDLAGIGLELRSSGKRLPRYLVEGGKGGSAGSYAAGQTVGGSAGSAETAGSTSGGSGGSGGSSGGGGSGDGSGGGGGGGGGTGPCGANPGVTSNQVNVYANIVTDGPGASFLNDAQYGIEAVINAANVHGVNGRRIHLQTINDDWDAAKGAGYIDNYTKPPACAFALVVNPSSEGLNLAVQNGTIDNNGLPVVGSDGMLISQYRWPIDGSGPGKAKWVWPVASSTVSTMHVIADYGKHHYGAQTFGLVYDNHYKFGVEGAEAFTNELDHLGVPTDNVHTLGIDPTQGDFSNAVSSFNDKCGTDSAPKCDVVAMLLDSSTALKWIKQGGVFGKKVTNGPQTLFNHDFAQNCAAERKVNNQRCHDFIVWTGYNPPVGALASQKDVAAYVNSVHSVNGQADVENSFTEGAYLGAKVFVQALQQAGPDLTRAALQAQLDSMTYTSGLSNPLTWSPSSHFANTAVHAFRIGLTGVGDYSGWSDENTGWIKDPRVGQF